MNGMKRQLPSETEGHANNDLFPSAMADMLVQTRATKVSGPTTLASALRGYCGPVGRKGGQKREAYGG